MSAVKEYLDAQLRDTLQKATGLTVLSIAVKGEPASVDVAFDLGGPGSEALFWQAVKEAHD